MNQTNFRRASFVLLALLLLCGVLVACTGNETPFETLPEESDSESETEVPTPEDLRVIAGGTSQYVIVRPDDCSQEITDAVLNLRDRMTGATGVKLEVKNDFLNEKLGLVESPYEILIGATNREASVEEARTLRTDDFVIRVSGTKLLILGGSDEATVKAIQYFADNFLSEELIYPATELHRFSATYAVGNLTICGVPISEYTIVFGSGQRSMYISAAEVLNERLAALTGITLPVVSSSEPASEHELLLGLCGRGPLENATPPEGLAYTVLQKDGSVALSVAGSLLSKAAMRDFCDRYLPLDAEGDLAVDLPGTAETVSVRIGSDLEEGAELRIMTNNILGNSEMATRAPLLLEVYMDVFPDVIGLQECGSQGYSLVVEKLKEFYGVTCRFIGNDGETNCCTPILYRKDLFTVVESNSFLYDKRWPKTNTKTLSYAVLEHKETKQKFLILNTHCAIITSDYDTLAVFGEKYTNSVQGAQWREDNSRQILETLASFQQRYGTSLPVIAMGDMNANANAKSIKMLTESAFRDCIDAATVKKTTGTASWHSVGQSPASGPSALPIDHLFVTDAAVKVYTHMILYKGQTVLNSTDHCPVYCDISFR